MRAFVKIPILAFFLLFQPSFLLADQSTQEIQDGWDDFNDNIKKYAEERTINADTYAENVDMFVVKNVSISPDAMYRTMDDSRPLPQVLSRVYMGDKMILQRYGYFADCIIPTFETRKNFMGGWVYFIKANVPICKTKPKDKKYTPPYVNGVRNGGDRTQIVQVTVKKNKKNGTYKVCLSEMGMKTACKKDATEDEVNMGPAFVSIEGGLQRTIEYAGKSGNQVKFIYSEFIDGMARDAFTRQFEIDLDEGNVAAYKGAVFEIIEANNAQITYKVIRHFQ